MVFRSLAHLWKCLPVPFIVSCFTQKYIYHLALSSSVAINPIYIHDKITVKVVSLLKHYAVKSYRGGKAILTLDRGEWWASYSGHFNPKEEALVPIK